MTGQPKKLFFTDLDDTLLNTQKDVTEENREAIRAALAGGHRITLTSGRPLSTSLPYVEKLGLNRPGCCLICFNGAVIYDCFQKEVLYSNPVNRRDAVLVFREAKKAGLHCHTYDSTGMVTAKHDPETDWYVERTGISVKVDPDIPASLKEPLYKLILIDPANPSRLEQFRRQMAQAGENHVDFFYSCPELLECVSSGVSKGSAIQWLVKYFGASINATVAVGDSENDIPMLRAVHTGCAMANASGICKDAADYITKQDCNHSGVAEVLRKFVIC